MNCLPGLEVRPSKSRCWQSHTPFRGSRGDSFLTGSSFWWLQCSLACGITPPMSAFIFTWPFLLWACVLYFSISYKNNLSLGLGTTLVQGDLILDLYLKYISKDPYFESVHILGSQVYPSIQYIPLPSVQGCQIFFSHMAWPAMPLPSLPKLGYWAQDIQQVLSCGHRD